MGNSNTKKQALGKEKKIDEKSFFRIKTKFQEYWKVLFRLITVYIVAYLVWFFAANKISDFFKNKGVSGWTKTSLTLAIFVVIIQGLLFALDGWVTSLLKSPFNQMCYAVNKAEGISDKQKDYIITKATESNEHCKETLKKFGILAISQELVRIFIRAEKILNTKDNGDYAGLLYISYLIPLTFAFWSIWRIRRELKKIEKLNVNSHVTTS